MRADGSHAGGGLARGMGWLGALFLAVSCLSPSIAVFVVAADVMQQIGSGVFLSFIAAALFGLVMAFVYGELGSALPGSGGEYTIVGRVFGLAWAKPILGLNLLGFSISLALSAQGVGTYLGAVLPGAPVRAVAATAVVVVTGLAVLRIEVGTWVTGAFLLVELVACATLAWLGLTHAHASPSILLQPQVARGSGPLHAPVLSALAAGAAAGIYAYNGYGAAIFFGEDMRHPRRDVAPVIIAALLIGAAIVLPPVTLLLMGAPDLRAVLSARQPVLAFVRAAGGDGLTRYMSAGVAMALFNTMIAIALMAGRQLYATGRDRLWSRPVSDALAATHPKWGSPWLATLIMGGLGLLACTLDPHVLVLILGNSNVLTYGALCLAVIHGRRNGATGEGVWRMPAFPIPAILCLAFLAAVIVASCLDAEARVGLLVSLGTAAISAVVLARAGVRGRGSGRSSVASS